MYIAVVLFYQRCVVSAASVHASYSIVWRRVRFRVLIKQYLGGVRDRRGDMAGYYGSWGLILHRIVLPFIQKIKRLRLTIDRLKEVVNNMLRLG